MTTLSRMPPTTPTPSSGRRLHVAMTPPFLTGTGAVGGSVELIRWAESVGYDDVWLADAGGTDALTLAAIVLERTERIRVGIAVVPAYTRTPAVLAATVATLADLAPGRFALGLGTGSEAMIEGWHGLRLDKPVARVEETVRLLKQMLAGEKTSFTGQTLRSTGYQQPPLDTEVPILLAALGPRMTELAATLCHGVVFNLFPLSSLEVLTGRVFAAALEAGRQPGEVEVASRFQVLVTDDIDTGREAFRRQFAPYYANPVYNRFLASAGYPDVAARVIEAARTGDWRAARAALTDELVDSVAVIGDEAHCRERLRTYFRAGVTTQILFCLSPDPDVQRATFAALSPAELGVRS